MTTSEDLLTEALEGKTGPFTKNHVGTIFQALDKLKGNPYPELLVLAKDKLERLQVGRIRTQEIKRYAHDFINSIDYSQKYIDTALRGGQVNAADIARAKDVWTECRKSLAKPSLNAQFDRQAEYQGFSTNTSIYNLLVFHDMSIELGQKDEDNGHHQARSSCTYPRPGSFLKRTQLLPFGGQIYSFSKCLLDDQSLKSLLRILRAELANADVRNAVRLWTRASKSLISHGSVAPRWARGFADDLVDRPSISEITAAPITSVHGDDPKSVTYQVEALMVQLEVYINFKIVSNGIIEFIQRLRDLNVEYRRSPEADFNQQLRLVAVWTLDQFFDILETDLAQQDDMTSFGRPRYKTKFSPVTESQAAVARDLLWRLKPARNKYKMLDLLYALCQLSMEYKPTFPSSEEFTSLHGWAEIKRHRFKHNRIHASHIRIWAKVNGITLRKLPANVRSLPALLELLVKDGYSSAMDTPAKEKASPGGSLSAALPDRWNPKYDRKVVNVDAVETSPESEPDSDAEAVESDCSQGPDSSDEVDILAMKLELNLESPKGLRINYP